jgi:hypothetical protein
MTTDAPSPAPVPPVSAEAQVRAEIDTLRTAPYSTGESDIDRLEKIETAYKKLYPPAAPTPAESLTPKPDGDWTPPADIGLPTLPHGTEWDVPIVRGLYDSAGAKGLASSEVTQALGVIAGVIGEERRWTAADLQREIISKHGEGRWEYLDTFAGEVAQILPRTLLRDLTRSGVIFNPRVVEELARIGEKLRDPMTPQGLARLKEIFSED